MADLILQRISLHPGRTYGVWLDGDGVPLAPTIVALEEAWRDNQPRISCIPAGTYPCRWVDSPKFGRTVEIVGVPGRSHILLHAGNDEDDTLGCVLPGETFGPIRGRIGVLQSKVALARLLAPFAGRDFTLTVRNP